ncbi:MAG: HNH endonuclease [Armatimonadetes bacterium]|nr:HNH endonuclease [Armatimonadota bacterium]
MNKAGFLMLLTKGRSGKGSQAISRKFRPPFPHSTQKVTALFEGESKPHRKPCIPFKATTRESRAYSLRQRLLKHEATVGNWVEVIAEEAGYQLTFRKRSEEEVRYRNELQEAETEEQATNALRKLTQTQKRSLREAAIKELRRLSRRTWDRKRVVVTPRERYEGVPASLRALLKTVYEGRCRICGFTFRKRNGEPYFEVHHVDPEGGHQPQNLLVLCANCHAQTEHSDVSARQASQGWVVAVTINGERRPVYQALFRSLPTRPMLLALWSFLTLYHHATSLRI